MEEGRSEQRSQVRRSQYYKKPQRQEQYEQLEGEYKYARWFWNRGERESWSASKMFVTFVASMVILAIGFITLSNLISPITAGIGMGTLVIMVLLANSDIRGWAVRQILRKRSYAHTRPVTSYEGLKFYFLEDHEEILFVENGRDLTGVGLFKLKAIPLVIKGNFERFIRSLYQQQIPVWWSYIQAPVEQGSILNGPAVSEAAHEFYDAQPPHEFDSRIESRNGVWVVRLILGTRRTVSATMNIENKRVKLYEQLIADIFAIKTAFISAYPHTVLDPLHGKNLELAMSINITGGGIPAFF